MLNFKKPDITKDLIPVIPILYFITSLVTPVKTAEDFECFHFSYLDDHFYYHIYLTPFPSLLITISYCNKAEQPSKKKQTATSRAIKRYSASHVKSQKIQNLGYNSLTVSMHSIYIMASGYPKRIRSHLCLGKLGSVKLNKHKSGRS